MNKTVTIESKNHKYANTYGGLICQFDFCTDYEGSKNIADKIASAWRFDRSCNMQMKNSIRSYKEKVPNNKNN